MTLWKRLLCLSAIALCTAFLANAQENAELTGTVKDQSGAVVPNARVTLTNASTAEVRAGTTNSAGLYDFPALHNGTYNMKVALTGFETYEKPFNLVMQLLGDCEQIYTRGDPITRRLMNMVFFEQIKVCQGEVADWELKDPWYVIRRHAPSVQVSDVSGESSNKRHLAAGTGRHSNSGRKGSNKKRQAPPTGFEPVLPP